MRILIVGATGFLGRALAGRLRVEGHTITAWARSPDRAHAVLPAGVTVLDARGGPIALAAAISEADGVVNLAGETLFGRRWTAARRRVLEDSRVQVTADLVRAIEAAGARPRVLVSQSAVGWYGDRGDEVLTEESSPGDDFLAQLCRRWEEQASGAERFGVRVVTPRTGVVLGPGGGALAPMLLPFRLGLGGPIGHGLQYMPWIHIDDFTAAVAAFLIDDRYRGAVNLVAPQATTSRAFTSALGRALHRPAVIPVPAFALRALFGESAIVVLASQRVEPRVLSNRGFSFARPDLDDALRSALGR